MYCIVFEAYKNPFGKFYLDVIVCYMKIAFTLNLEKNLKTFGGPLTIYSFSSLR